MATEPTSLRGQLLLDGGKLRGSFFHRSVVLICQHDADGAFGLILNRATESKVGQALVVNLPELIKEQPLFVGGPVQPGSLSFLHANGPSLQPDVMANVQLGHSIDALMDLSDSFVTGQKLRMFAGYAGWSPGQLDQELARQDWLARPATLDLIFDTDPSLLWKVILKQMDAKHRLLADSPEDLSWN